MSYHGIINSAPLTKEGELSRSASRAGQLIEDLFNKSGNFSAGMHPCTVEVSFDTVDGQILVTVKEV